MSSAYLKPNAIDAGLAPKEIFNLGPQHQPAHAETLTAESMWERLSPGSLFFKSRVGRHLMVEHLLVNVEGLRSFVCVAHLSGDRGENAEALINRHLFSLPPFWEPFLHRPRRPQRRSGRAHQIPSGNPRWPVVLANAAPGIGVPSGNKLIDGHANAVYVDVAARLMDEAEVRS